MLSDIPAFIARPTFLTKRQFTKDESSYSAEIAHLGVHVEREIRREKEFHYFEKPVYQYPSLRQAFLIKIIFTVAVL